MEGHLQDMADLGDNEAPLTRLVGPVLLLCSASLKVCVMFTYKH